MPNAKYNEIAKIFEKHLLIIIQWLWGGQRERDGNKEKEEGDR